MSKEHNLIKKISRLSTGTKIKIIFGLLLTAGLISAIVGYGWFNEQKKAAEMFKVQYPNALYINAAHREDRVFFELGGIDVNGYEKDEKGDVIYYRQNSDDPCYVYTEGDNPEPMIDEEGHYVYDKTNGNARKITNKQYVFSVSGSNMDEFILQLSHTNNNQFIYKVYEATQYTSKTSIPAGTDDKLVVKYTTTANSHNENTLQVAFDQYNDSGTANPRDLYYVRGANPIASGDFNGEYKNDISGSGTMGNRDMSNEYYKETYGTYPSGSVNQYAMPTYWQADIELDSLTEIDANKGFCKYFILEVTWPNNYTVVEKKETDMVYISAKRK